MLRNKFLKKFKNEKTDFQFVFSGMPGTRSWVIEIDHGKARVFRGELDFPRTIVNASARDFIDTTTGYLNPEKALMAGKMTVNGPVMKMTLSVVTLILMCRPVPEPQSQLKKILKAIMPMPCLD